MANRIQPVLRYDLGDSVLVRPDPCPCGNPLPAIRVQGRAADGLKFVDGGGKEVTLPPLALEVDDAPGLERFQLVQISPTKVRLRIRTKSESHAADTWQRVEWSLRRVLDEHQLGNVAIERGDEPPEQTVGGKFRMIVGLAPSNQN